MQLRVGSRVRVFGGYDYEPKWLSGQGGVVGTLLRWSPGRNRQLSAVVLLDEPLTAEGDIDGIRRIVTGRHLVLEVRYVDQAWGDDGTVHVEVCEAEPANVAWSERPHGAWVESHATYQCI